MAYDYANPYNLPTVGNWKPENTQNFLGSDFNILKEILNTQRATGDPNKSAYSAAFQKKLGRSTGRAVKNIKEQLADSGFRGTGANLIGDIYESEAIATGDFENQMADRDLQVKQTAIAQLLGLNQFEGTQKFAQYQSGVQQDQFLKSFLENQRQFNENLKFQKDSQPSFLEELLGTLLGSGAKVAASAL